VETKCDSADNEIVREYRVTAKATYLKGPTSVKDMTLQQWLWKNNTRCSKQYRNLMTVNLKIFPLVVTQVS
jgi:hypothetical protein